MLMLKKKHFSILPPTYLNNFRKENKNLLPSQLKNNFKRKKIVILLIITNY